MVDFKTFEEQLDILKSRNLIIENDEETIAILKTENYYNIINGYKAPFLKSNSGKEDFKDNVTFNEIFLLYQFDRAIRSIIFKSILQVENTLRTQISYVFSKYHNSANYLCYNNFETLLNGGTEKPVAERAIKIHSLISNLQRDISSSIKYKEYIKHYVIDYGYVPLWVLVNAIPLNRLSSFYRVMNQSERIEVSQYWNIMEKDLRQFISKLANFRNLCAHDERIYCSYDDTIIPDNDVHQLFNIDKDGSNNYTKGKTDLFSLVIVLKKLLPPPDFTNFYNQLNGRIISLSTKLNSIQIDEIFNAMGFPPNWEKIKTS